MVDKHVLDCLEPDEGAVGALLGLVGVVLQAALSAVEDEPAALPLPDGGASAQLGQVAVTRGCGQLDVVTLVKTMTGCLDEPSQVHVTVTYRQIACQRTRGRLEHASTHSNR